MKLSIIAAATAALAISPLAFADDGFNADMDGTGAFNTSVKGFAGAKSKVISNGFSFQSSWSHARGSAGVTFDADMSSADGNFTGDAESYQHSFASSGSFGHSFGNTPGSKNLATGFATSENNAWAHGDFDMAEQFGDGWEQ